MASLPDLEQAKHVLAHAASLPRSLRENVEERDVIRLDTGFLQKMRPNMNNQNAFRFNHAETRC